MMNLQKDISKQALHLRTIGQFVKLTKGQYALLKVIRISVEKQRAINWDLLVSVFYNNVSKTGSYYEYIGEDWKSRVRQEYEYDIMESYKNQDSHWKYSVRSRIKQWFVSTIGILVIKNQLIVIPTIELDSIDSPIATKTD